MKRIRPIIVRANKKKEKSHGATKVATLLEHPCLSIAKVRKTSDNVKLGYDKESDVAYYVLKGKGDCIINGKKYSLKKGDLIFYPRGTQYKHLKGLTLLAISSPPFSRKKRVYVE